MNTELKKHYAPLEVEERWYKYWEDNGFFGSKPNPDKIPYAIIIPPPNVTGILHMGHALNNTIQDILIRYKRMLGYEALWFPGTDHAGIATQNVVEKTLLKDGLKRQDLGRDKFIEKVWLWREKYGSTIIHQLKKIGASCDWGRLRFTMDQDYSKVVTDIFIKLYEKGLIYRGRYIINWCPRCQTALSNEEAAHQPLKGELYYLRYPLKDSSEYILVATTRPETMLGDTAIAVNPKDSRYKKLIGKIAILPLMNRPIKIIADNSIDMKFGTGAVKITPAHDLNDYLLGKKHNLDFINVMQPDAKMNTAAGKYCDLDRFKAREEIIKDLKSLGLLEKIEPHKLSVGHCYRCNTIVEPYLSKQWFVKMQPLTKPAIKAVKDKKIKFYPNRWTKVYLNWMNNIQDWCISRQIWWGHRIPVYYCKDCSEDKQVIVSKIKPQSCPKCNGSNIYQDEDVLDTWFSSWLWPFAALSEKDLEYYYPSATLVTAPEIIFFWVARMIMAGLEFMGRIPFKDVYIHGTVRDREGKKMSKSLGNSIDPLGIIKEYGTDALRFSLISATSQGQDLFLSKEKFEQGRNFANKIWNASRFILMNLDIKNTVSNRIPLLAQKSLTPLNSWILSRFYSTLIKVEKYLSAYKLNEAINIIYSFFWHEFCDRYLEIIKQDIANPHNQLIMYDILEKTLRITHPFMPFLTEEIWQRLPGKNKSIMTSSWPKIKKEAINTTLEKEMAEVFEVVGVIRAMRTDLNLATNDTTIKVQIYPSTKSSRLLLESHTLTIKQLLRLNQVTIENTYKHSKNTYVNILKGMHIVIPLEGVADIQKQIENIEIRIVKYQSDIKTKRQLLKNKNFVKKAPQEIIDTEKQKLRTLIEELKKIRGLKDGLKT